RRHTRFSRDWSSDVCSSDLNGFSFSGGSSTDTPTTCRPCSPYCSCSSTKPGISALQGGHHVAQKSSRMTFPLKSASLTERPWGRSEERRVGKGGRCGERSGG